MKLLHDDIISLLANALGIKKKKAEELLADWVSAVKKEVEEKGSYHIDGLGSMVLEDGNLVFKPEEKLAIEVNYKYAGMNPIEILPAYSRVKDQEKEIDSGKEDEAAGMTSVDKDSTVKPESESDPDPFGETELEETEEAADTDEINEVEEKNAEEVNFETGDPGEVADVKETEDAGATGEEKEEDGDPFDLEDDITDEILFGDRPETASGDSQNSDDAFDPFEDEAIEGQAIPKETGQGDEDSRDPDKKEEELTDKTEDESLFEDEPDFAADAGEPDDSFNPFEDEAIEGQAIPKETGQGDEDSRDPDKKEEELADKTEDESLIKDEPDFAADAGEPDDSFNPFLEDETIDRETNWEDTGKHDDDAIDSDDNHSDTEEEAQKPDSKEKKTREISPIGKTTGIGIRPPTKTLDRSGKKSAKTRKTEPEPKSKAKVAESEAKTDPDIRESKTVDSNTKKYIVASKKPGEATSKIWLVPIAAVLILVVMLIFHFEPRLLERLSVSSTDDMATVKSPAEEMTPAPGGEEETQDNGAVAQDEAETVQESGETTEDEDSPFGLMGQEEDVLRGSYTIVLHSILNEDRARRIESELKEQGFKTTLWQAGLPDGSATWRVGVGQFETVTDAEQVIPDLPEPYRSNNFIIRIR